MITHRIQGLYRIHFMLQILVVVSAFWLYAFTMVEFYNYAWFSRYVLYCALMVLGLIYYEFRSDHDYHIGVLHGSLKACHNLAAGKVLFSTLFIGLYLLATRDATISRIFLFSFLPLMYMVLLISDRWIPRWLARLIFKGVHEQRTLLVGSDYRAGGFSEWLVRKRFMGVKCVGLLRDNKSKSEILKKPISGLHAKPRSDVHKFPVLGTPDDLERVIRERAVTHVILLESPMFSELITQMVYICNKLGVRLLMVDNLEEKVLHPITYFEDDGVRFFSLLDEPLQNPVNRLLKRSLDIVVSLPVVAFVLPPLTVLIWIIQRFYSPGPVFYWQPRAGLLNQEFRILKFRTMHVDHGQIGRQATKNDPRIYPGGKLLRKFSLDELPQFWNVLVGDMSVVGPRPHLLEHNQRFARLLDNYYIRAYVKPGITGLAQVKGFRGETKRDEDLVQRVQWDLYYIENWSLGMELTIIAKTFGQVFFPSDYAY